MTQHILTAHSFSTRIVEQLIDAIRSYRQHRLEVRAIKETEHQLGKLSDYDLADIGLTRGDIYTVARSNETINNIKTNNNLRGWV
jgi:uncharacterized protein YjiS (DUF1127 family)